MQATRSRIIPLPVIRSTHLLGRLHRVNIQPPPFSFEACRVAALAFSFSFIWTKTATPIGLSVRVQVMEPRVDLLGGEKTGQKTGPGSPLPPAEFCRTSGVLCIVENLVKTLCHTHSTTNYLQSQADLANSSPIHGNMSTTMTRRQALCR